MATPLYRGFSTVANRGIDTRLYNVDLVTQDLLNHFNTRIGERVARPGFGSIIHDLLYDLMDPRTEALVVADASRIFSEDPSVIPLRLRHRLLRSPSREPTGAPVASFTISNPCTSAAPATFPVSCRSR